MNKGAIYLNHEYSGFEPLQIFDVIYGGHFEHRLIRSGHASMQHQRLILGEVRLESGSYDFPVIAQGSMPHDAICIGLVADGVDATRFNTAAIAEDEIQIYPLGVELLYHASASSRWVTLTATEKLLQNTAFVRAGRSLALKGPAGASIRLRPGERRRLVALADDAMSLARSLDAGHGISPALAGEVSRALIDAYVDALSSATRMDSRKNLEAATRHYHVIRACERLITSGQEANIALAEVARRSGYSLRSLELIFRNSVGTTPGRWFLNVRLNGALRDLLKGGEAGCVTEIALRWGFRHLARFAAHYRIMFGELPSETLRRSTRMLAR
ncbi:helix-turn-helix transcriptional regulator [Paraburkholderia sacchari]|uniref:helix-turn-helix transcriptional regulator n=1 Tax=Paraburkholderia sacchari TaxID=159450 RepID=UPI003D992AAA